MLFLLVCVLLKVARGVLLKTSRLGHFGQRPLLCVMRRRDNFVDTYCALFHDAGASELIAMVARFGPSLGVLSSRW